MSKAEKVIFANSCIGRKEKQGMTLSDLDLGLSPVRGLRLVSIQIRKIVVGRATWQPVLVGRTLHRYIANQH